MTSHAPHTAATETNDPARPSDAQRATAALEATGWEPQHEPILLEVNLELVTYRRGSACILATIFERTHVELWQPVTLVDNVDAKIFYARQHGRTVAEQYGEPVDILLDADAMNAPG